MKSFMIKNRIRIIVSVALVGTGCTGWMETLEDKRESVPPKTETVEVQVDHCFVRPVPFAGELWTANPPPFDGTTLPRNWSGEGIMSRTSERSATYRDEGSDVDLPFTSVQEGEDGYPDYPCQ